MEIISVYTEGLYTHRGECLHTGGELSSQLSTGRAKVGRSAACRTAALQHSPSPSTSQVASQKS